MTRLPRRLALLAAALLFPLVARPLPGRPRGARDHALRGGNPHLVAHLACKDCHGEGAPNRPARAACLGCHGPADELVRKTAAVKPENPHASPHWGTDMECWVCHRQHAPTVNWCAHCHAFDVAVP